MQHVDLEGEINPSPKKPPKNAGHEALLQWLVEKDRIIGVARQQIMKVVEDARTRYIKDGLFRGTGFKSPVSAIDTFTFDEVRPQDALLQSQVKARSSAFRFNKKMIVDLSMRRLFFRTILQK